MRQEERWLLIDNRKRHFFLKYEIYFLLLKKIKVTTQIPLIYRQYILYKLALLLPIRSQKQQINRCIHTGRTWGVLNKFQSSRFVLRLNAYKGNISGLRRLSW